MMPLCPPFTPASAADKGGTLLSVTDSGKIHTLAILSYGLIHTLLVV